MKAEVIAKQFSDPRWRLSNLYEITDKDGRRVPFRPNSAQLDLLSRLTGRDVIPKARQLGVTTLLCLVGLDEALFRPQWSVGVIAHQLDAAREIFRAKVREVYDALPEGLRSMRPTVRDAADALEFSTGSSIRVATSMRSGTLQRLHVSEFGKICARYPDRAREIVTGSFPAAERGAITVESTAEGAEGRFWEMVQRAKPDATGRDWRLHFLPWWRDAGYALPPEAATITADQRDYFARLETEHGIRLTPHQQAWYSVTEAEQAGDMRREYPSTLEEAFEASIEGAYFARQFLYADRVGTIGRFPPDPRAPVHSFWDLGRNDCTAIWLMQPLSDRLRMIGYYETSGEHISHYAGWLRRWIDDRALVHGDVYWPHDGDRDDLFLPSGRLAVAREHGLAPKIVPRPAHKLEAIETGRTVFGRCDWDEAACAAGLTRLRRYRKAWDDQRGVWKDRPEHNDDTHAADAFLTMACGFRPNVSKLPSTGLLDRRRAGGSWMA